MIDAKELFLQLAMILGSLDRLEEKLDELSEQL